MKKQNGITLVSLIVIIAVLLILASVSVKFGTESMDVTRLKGFYLELETVQKRVDEMYVNNETYSINGEIYSVRNEENKEDIKMLGKDVIEAGKKETLEKIFTEEEIDMDISAFRYFEIADIEKYLDLTDINYNLFINFEERKIIAEQGINIAGVDYYVLKNDAYIVEQPANDKNKGDIGTLKYSKPIEYGNNKYKIAITPGNTIGDIGGAGHLKYKRDQGNFWNTSENDEIVIEFNILYIVKYIDLNNNTIEEKIMVVYQTDKEGNFVKDENGDNRIDIVDENGKSKLNNQNESEEI